MTAAVRIQREVLATDRGSQRGLDLVAGTERVFVRRQLDRIRHAEPALQLVDRHAWRVCLQAQHAGGGILEGLVCRSEEHTSELQSLMRSSYAVFCLKKKKSARQTQGRRWTDVTNVEQQEETG